MTDEIHVRIGCRCGEPDCESVLVLRRLEGNASVVRLSLELGEGHGPIVLNGDSLCTLRGTCEAFKSDMRQLAEASLEGL